MHKLSYHPGSTAIHKLYPATKLLWLLAASFLVFLTQNGIFLISMAGLLLILLLSVQPQVFQVRGFRFAFIIGSFLFLLYVLFDKSGRTLVPNGTRFFEITLGGIEAGLQFSGRFLTIVFLSYLFVITTNPSDLAYALMKLGLPYRLGFMLVTALRLAPLMEEEGRTIYRAQLVRGVRYDQRSFKRLLLLIRQFLSPLLISALRRADKLVFSMEGRGFGQYPHRTFRRRAQPTWRDSLALVFLVLFAALIILNPFGGFV
jgi:energy-coupling factor transport system permease protein